MGAAPASGERDDVLVEEDAVPVDVVITHHRVVLGMYLKGGKGSQLR
jgi:hypothetical protein